MPYYQVNEIFLCHKINVGQWKSGCFRGVVTVPSGFAVFPHDLIRILRNFLPYKFHNITSYTDMPRGGHFAAFKESRLLADDIYHFAATVETFN